MTLSDLQSWRLTELGEDWHVVASDQDCPVVESPAGRLFRIDEEGELHHASSELVATRDVDIFFPLVAA